MPLTFQVSAQVNLDRQGRPLPVVVRLLQLRGTARLGVQSVDSLWQDSRAALGQDWVEEREIVLYPQDRHQEKLLLSEAANHVVVMVLFREPVGTDWRVVVPVTTDVLACGKEQVRAVPFDIAGARVRRGQAS